MFDLSPSEGKLQLIDKYVDWHQLATPRDILRAITSVLRRLLQGTASVAHMRGART